MLGLLRKNLNDNLWKIVNGNMVKQFDFNKYMKAVYLDTTGQVNPNDKYFVENRAEEMRDNYNKTLREINKGIKSGNILREKKKITKAMNEKFKEDMRRFVNEAERR